MKPRTKMKRLAAAVLTAGLMATAGRQRQAQAAGTAYVDLQVSFSGTLSVTVDGVSDSTRTLVNAAQANPTSSQYAGLPTGSSITVTNNGTVTETWTLSVGTFTGAGWQLNNATGTTASATCVGGAGSNCPGANQYALEAVFISSANAGGCSAQAPIDNSGGAATYKWGKYEDRVPAAVGYNSALQGNANGLYQGGFNGSITTQRFADSNALNSVTGLPDSYITAYGLGQDGTMMTAGGSSGAGQKGLCVRATMPASSSSGCATEDIRLTITATCSN